MPGMDGIELQRRLRASKVAMPVIVMTGHGDIALAVEAMKAGAVDFIEKPFDDEVLIGAIRSALARRAEDAKGEARAAEMRGRLKLLSERERQVLDGLVAGKPNKIIAHDLGISPRTVEIYRANVMTKMQADSLSALVRMVLARATDRSETAALSAPCARSMSPAARRRLDWPGCPMLGTVLVVDDDAAVRSALKFALEVEGFNVRLYAGPEALLADPICRPAAASSSTTACRSWTGWS